MEVANFCAAKDTLIDQDEFKDANEESGTSALCKCVLLLLFSSFSLNCREVRGEMSNNNHMSAVKLE